MRKTIVRLLPELCTTAVILLMVAASDALHEREILFPEIAALATGYLLAPRRTWRVSSGRMLLFIAAGALTGLAIVVLVPLPLWQQFVLAFAVSQLLYIFSGTTLAPMISAIVLPAVLQTRSLIYPVSAAVLTTLIVLLRLALERVRLRPQEPFTPSPAPRVSIKDPSLPTGRGALTDALLRILLIALVSYPVIRLGRILVLAPPLLVAFTEFTNPLAGARKKPAKTVLFLTLCGTEGALIRLILHETLGVPLPAAAAAATVLFLLLVRSFHLYLPPAGAAVLLAFLIPSQQLASYPLQILTGSSILMGLAVLIFRKASVKTC